MKKMSSILLCATLLSSLPISLYCGKNEEPVFKKQKLEAHASFLAHDIKTFWAKKDINNFYALFNILKHRDQNACDILLQEIIDKTLSDGDEGEFRYTFSNPLIQQFIEHTNPQVSDQILGTLVDYALTNHFRKKTIHLAALNDPQDPESVAGQIWVNTNLQSALSLK